VFSITEGEGMFGTVTEELKHIAVEGFLDHALPGKVIEPDFNLDFNFENANVGSKEYLKIFLDHALPVIPNESLDIKAPLAFLNDVFTAPVKNLGGSGGKSAPPLAPAGALAGPYFVKLIELQASLHKLSSRNTWPSMLTKSRVLLPAWVEVRSVIQNYF
jgi:hypothetical protein